jgi:hypothetical protein
LGVRDERRLDAHVAHCQDCRRHARLSGVDGPLPARPAVRAKIAAVLPLPAVLRRRLESGGGSDVPGGGWSSALASVGGQASGYAEPLMVWTKAAVVAATVAVAGVGAGQATQSGGGLGLRVAGDAGAAVGPRAAPDGGERAGGPAGDAAGDPGAGGPPLSPRRDRVAGATDAGAHGDDVASSSSAGRRAGAGRSGNGGASIHGLDLAPAGAAPDAAEAPAVAEIDDALVPPRAAGTGGPRPELPTASGATSEVEDVLREASRPPGGPPVVGSARASDVVGQATSAAAGAVDTVLGGG